MQWLILWKQVGVDFNAAIYLCSLISSNELVPLGQKREPKRWNMIIKSKVPTNFNSPDGGSQRPTILHEMEFFLRLSFVLDFWSGRGCCDLLVNMIFYLHSIYLPFTSFYIFVRMCSSSLSKQSEGHRRPCWRKHSQRSWRLFWRQGGSQQVWLVKRGQGNRVSFSQSLWWGWLF